MRIMHFENSARSQDLQTRVAAFMDEHVYPNESTFHRQIAEGDRWQPTAIVEELKPKARAAGLWNLFLPESEYGAGLTNVEYAPLCEIMGRVPGIGPKSSTVRRPIPATWKSWSATAARRSASSGSIRCSPERFAAVSR
jgi:acyl-CoA dehydrogenase